MAVVAAVHEVKNNGPQNPADDRHTVVAPVLAADATTDSTPKPTDLAAVLVDTLLGLLGDLLGLLDGLLQGLVGDAALLDALLEAEIIPHGHELLLAVGGGVGDRGGAVLVVVAAAGLARGVTTSIAFTLVRYVHLDLAGKGVKRRDEGRANVV